MIDTSELGALVSKIEAAQRDLKPYMGKFLDEIGEEFLDIVKAEIEAAGNVDYGLLLASFNKYRPANIYEIDLGALTLTVGTSVKYAKWVNSGHREYERKQTPGRFIPGVWVGNKFQYQPGAKTGMVLKASTVNMPATEGSHFFDKAVEALKIMIPTMADNAFEQFFRRYF